MLLGWQEELWHGPGIIEWDNVEDRNVETLEENNRRITNRKMQEHIASNWYFTSYLTSGFQS